MYVILVYMFFLVSHTALAVRVYLNDIDIGMNTSLRFGETVRSWALLHALALLFLLLGLDCRMEYFLVADFWKLWVNLVHCCTAELAVCENEFPVLEAQRLDSGSDGLKHNSNKSTTGGMIPGSFTPTILPDAYFDILSSSPTISFSYTSL